MMGAMSWGHWAIVILVVILLFGRGMVSSLMADVGKAIKEVRRMGADEPS
jgi:sec-independent protein translocase protein TatA